MDKHAQETRVVSAQVPEQIRTELVRLATDGGRTLSSEVRRALAAHVQHERAGAAA